MSCPDRPGLVAAMAQILHGHGCNIVESDQYTDEAEGQFFQRICFDHTKMVTDRHSLQSALDEVAQRFDMRWQLRWGDRAKKIAVFVSKYDHCLVDLLWRHRAGELDCAIPVIVSNHPDLADTAAHYGIRYEVFDTSARSKTEIEAAQCKLLDEFDIDLVVLARYMQILSPEFCRRWDGRIVNIHHSFLPAFVGGRPYHQAHDRGVKLIGATAHLVTEQLDEGPIIEQDVQRTSHRDSVDDLVRKGRDMERLVLSRALRYLVEDRVLAYGHRTVVFSD